MLLGGAGGSAGVLELLPAAMQGRMPPAAALLAPGADLDEQELIRVPKYVAPRRSAEEEQEERALLGLGHVLLADITANRLEVVSVPGRCLDEQAAAALSYAVSKSSIVHTLDVSANYVGDEGARVLSRALGACPSLMALDASDNDVGPSGGIELARGVRDAHRLQHLYLSFNALGVGGALAMAAAVAHSTTLLTLDLSFNGLGDDAVTAFVRRLISGADELEAARKPPPPLRMLQLSGNNVEEEGALACCRLLRKLRTTLKTLALSSNPLTDGAVLELINVIEETKATVLFNMGGANDFAWQDGCTAFRESLASLQNSGSGGTRGSAAVSPAAAALAAAAAMAMRQPQRVDEGDVRGAPGIPARQAPLGGRASPERGEAQGSISPEQALVARSLLPRVENTEYGVPYSPERRKFKAAATVSSLVSSMRRPGDTHDDAATVLGGKVGEGSVCAADKNALGEELDKISRS